MDLPPVSTTSIQISHPLHWRAILRIDTLSSAAQITATEVEELQQETLNPLINELLDLPEDDAARQLIYQRLTVLNQRLRKEHLPTVGIDRLFTLPQELISTLFGQLGYIKEPWSRAIAQRQEDSATYGEFEKNLQAGLGEERFEGLKQKCQLSENADAETRVKAIYREWRKEVREANGGVDPSFLQNLTPLSLEEIFYVREWGRSVLAIANEIHSRSGALKIGLIFPADVRSEEQRVNFARQWLADNQRIVSGVNTLDLSGKKLKVIPPEIRLLTTLKTLFLSFNRIKVIPPEIGQLTSLVDLKVDYNAIEVIPPEIGQLTALRHLDLDRNAIEAIPPEIGQLRALNRLDLENNAIKVICPEIGRLTALKNLYLNRNEIEVIPPEIGQLPSVNLEISENPIRVVPPGLNLPLA